MKLPFDIRLAGLALIVLISFTSGRAQKNTSKPPNIIFILTDDLGYGDIGIFYQNQRRQENVRSEPSHFTPNLDALAVSGARLTQQYCNAPVCAPSRASLLLGVHQGHAGVRDNQFDKALDDNYTLGNVLQQAGYATVCIGKWGLQGEEIWEKGSAWTALPLDRGFEHFFGYVRHVDGHEHYPKEGLYRGSKEVYRDRENITNTLDKCYTGDLWTAYAKQWIIQHKRGKESNKPFFMYLAYDLPHAVLELPTQSYPSGNGLTGGMQWEGAEGHMINTASGVIDSYVHPDYANATYDDDDNAATVEVPWPATYKRYATVVRRLDDAVGDIRKLLIDLGLDSNTLIVFTSDNGPSRESYLPEHYVTNEPTFFNSFGPFDGIKRDVWEGGVRMPTLVAWPKAIPENRVVTTPCMLSDWMATFCDIAGVPIPARSDGVSLMPSLTGKGKQRESTVYVEYFNNQKTPDYAAFEKSRRGRIRNQMQLIRMGDHVGVRYDIQSADDDFEIYDVIKDPKQRVNLAANAEWLYQQQAMKEKVLRVRRPNTSALRPYDSAIIPSVVVDEPVPGLIWKSFRGNFEWIPQELAIPLASAGKAKELAPVPLRQGETVLLYEGYFKIPLDGAYTFSIMAQGKALLRIHDATVIDADFGYESGTSKEERIVLGAGFHPFKMYYKRNATGSPDFTITWSGPGFEKQAVPMGILFCNKRH